MRYLAWPITLVTFRNGRSEPGMAEVNPRMAQANPGMAEANPPMAEANLPMAEDDKWQKDSSLAEVVPLDGRSTITLSR